MWFVMLHFFSVGLILWAVQAEARSGQTDVSCQRNMWADPWSGAKEDGSGPEQDLSTVCRKGDGPWVQIQGHTGFWELSLWLGKDIKKDCMGKASHWGAKFPNNGCQAWQQAVMFKCQLCHDRPNPLQHCPTTIHVHSSELPLCTVSEGRYQKNIKQRNVNTFKSLKCFLKLFGCQHSHL